MYTEILTEVKKDITTFIEYNKWVEEGKKAKGYTDFENQKFKSPTVTSLKKKFPTASAQEIKKKMLKALASQLEL